MTLSKTQRLLLEALSDCKLHTYRDIVMATGKYSNLPAELRERHPRSLGSKGLVRELVIDIGGVKVYAFQITTDGLRELGRPPNKPALIHFTLEQFKDDFKKRYERWREEYKQEEIEAECCGLRHNPYLLLRAMADGEEKTFADLARATGIFSGLPQYLRARHARHRSLASLGLIRETIIENEDGNGFTFAFTITKAGLALLNLR
jgi:hypothetical protein